jgi:hypothetical protein
MPEAMFRRREENTMQNVHADQDAWWAGIVQSQNAGHQGKPANQVIQDSTDTENHTHENRKAKKKQEKTTAPLQQARIRKTSQSPQHVQTAFSAVYNKKSLQLIADGCSCRKISDFPSYPYTTRR